MNFIVDLTENEVKQFELTMRWVGHKGTATLEDYVKMKLEEDRSYIETCEKPLITPDGETVELFK